MIHCKSCRREKSQEEFIDEKTQKEFKTCNLCRETRKVKYNYKYICSVEDCENNAVKGGVCIKHGAKIKRCSVENCENHVQQGGVCVKHGAKLKKCSVENCEHYVQKRGVCFKHGAEVKYNYKYICSVEDCENNAVKGGVCVKHGAKVKKYVCSVEDCENRAIQGGVCLKHGAKVKRCSVENCENHLVNGGVCVKHGAKVKRCSVENCENRVIQGGVCLKHGAKLKKCSVENCENHAKKGGVCIKHGAICKKCPHGLRPNLCRTCNFPKHPYRWCHSCTFVNITKCKNKFYYPYCFNCYCVKFPDADIPRAFKLKEHYLRDELIDEYKEIDVNLIFDKKVDNGCSSKRPDVRIERYTHTIIIECDENQHRNYECENKRMMEIFQDLGNRPVVFIRFNPDYYNKKTCFTKTPKTGQLKINKTEWDKRIKVLKETIDKYFPVQDKNVQVVKLFYNE